MREAGLPRPEPQVVFKDGERTLARVDFLFRDFGLVVEVSGQLGHATPTERARDAQRRNELQDLGLTVYEFTYDQVVNHTRWVQQQMRRRLRPPKPVLVTEPG
jgi:very-short-patch-repair endonuclease